MFFLLKKEKSGLSGAIDKHECCCYQLPGLKLMTAGLLVGILTLRSWKLETGNRKLVTGNKKNEPRC
jgi:hypothetical protein